MKDNLKLCYVDPPWAYFTSQDLDKQWGDDWNDAPYEHNAEEPYTGEGWEIVKVAYNCDLRTPAHNYLNSPFSVEQINAQQVPWLWTWDNAVTIHAGASLDGFVKAIKAIGGDVYTKGAQ